MSNPALQLPEPLSHQVAVLDSPASRKVVRAGRRYGKSRLAMIASIAGHGPGELGAKKFAGILQGRDVVWCAQDYPNLRTVMWREEFLPRFKRHPMVDMHEHPDMRVTIRGRGTLFLRPETAINGIRGIGKNLGGVVLDEAAFYDLEGALRDVILPALLDNGGWLLLMSTTNGGLDGNVAKRIPSYFNLLCHQIQTGARTAEWQEFYGTAYDNERLSHAAIKELEAEYHEGSVSLQQEVHALLVAGGGGLSFPDLRRDKHIVEPFQIPPHWPTFGAYDWGYSHPFSFGLFAVDTDGNVFLVESAHGRHLQTPEQAHRIKAVLRENGLAIPRVTYAGHDCWTERRAYGENTPTIAEQFVAEGMILDRANIDHNQGVQNLRAYVRWNHPERGDHPPRFRILRTPNNERVWDCLTTRVNDPDKLEDVLKIDADERGHGGDDDYDMVRMGLASRPMRAHIELGPPIHAFDPAVLAHEAEEGRKVKSTRPKRTIDYGSGDDHFGGM